MNKRNYPHHRQPLPSAGATHAALQHIREVDASARSFPSWALIVTIRGVWGCIGSDLMQACEANGAEPDNREVIEACCDAGRLGQYPGSPEIEAEYRKAIDLHGYGWVLARLSRHPRLQLV